MGRHSLTACFVGLQLGVLSTTHLAHTALTDQLLDLVVAQFCTSRQTHQNTLLQIEILGLEYMDRAVVRKGEKHLRDRFGDAYRESRLECRAGSKKMKGRSR